MCCEHLKYTWIVDEVLTAYFTEAAYKLLVFSKINLWKGEFQQLLFIWIIPANLLTFSGGCSGRPSSRHTFSGIL